MKYLCLAYYDLDKFKALTPTDMQALGAQCKTHDEALRASGKASAHASLSMPDQWKTIRPRGGKPMVSDGPFSEAKELVGSFFLIDADSIDEAVRIASLHPAAQVGEALGWGLDVRPCDMFVA
ncbi:MAG: YciI family protein [Moraxellaceae bacterium]|nr:YciI family protein [Moraxellaceae bacterium]